MSGRWHIATKLLSAFALQTVVLTPPLAAETLISAAPSASACKGGECRYRVTAQQIVAKAESLIAIRNFEAAKPLVAALKLVPKYRFQYRFLSGFIAVETGEFDVASKYFRAILKNDPGQTRVRLELARAEMLRGKKSSADYHFRLAQQDQDLPDEIAQTIRNTRSILRNQRNWRFGFDIGLAPDTNVNNATDAATVDINFGPIRLPLTLNADAKKRSGLGQTAGVTGGVRLRLSPKTALLVDGDARLVNYKGVKNDDLVTQLAVGPEFRVGKYTTLNAQAVVQQRWHGGKPAQTQYGAKMGLQSALGKGERIGVEVDARRTESKLSTSYTGWQFGANATYERIVGKSMIATVGVYGRRDLLNSQSFSDVIFGMNMGIGGELPHGINAGVSGGVSHAKFDAAQLLYSTDRRKEWRYSARAYVGSRQIRVLGFSPSVAYNYLRSDSNYTLYKTNRHKLNFKLARYF